MNKNCEAYRKVIREIHRDLRGVSKKAQRAWDRVLKEARIAKR
jgi:uncharacterized protein YecT (DUF1311 family)